MNFISTFQWETQWPLWVCKKMIFAGTVWIFIDEIPPLDTKPDGPLRAYEELRRLEHWTAHEGIRGWRTSVDWDNTKLMRALLIANRNVRFCSKLTVRF